MIVQHQRWIDYTTTLGMLPSPRLWLRKETSAVVLGWQEAASSIPVPENVCVCNENYGMSV